MSNCNVIKIITSIFPKNLLHKNYKIVQFFKKTIFIALIFCNNSCGDNSKTVIRIVNLDGRVSNVRPKNIAFNNQISLQSNDINNRDQQENINNQFENNNKKPLKITNQELSSKKSYNDSVALSNIDNNLQNRNSMPYNKNLDYQDNDIGRISSRTIENTMKSRKISSINNQNPQIITSEQKNLTKKELSLEKNKEISLNKNEEINQQIKTVENKQSDADDNPVSIIFKDSNNSNTLNDNKNEPKIMFKNRYIIADDNKNIKKSSKSNDFIDRQNSKISSKNINGIFIQIGAFKNRSNAQKSISKLSKNSQSRIEELVDRKGNKTYKSLIGPFKNKSDANKMLLKIKKSGNDGVLVNK